MRIQKRKKKSGLNSSSSGSGTDVGESSEIVTINFSFDDIQPVGGSGSLEYISNPAMASIKLATLAVRYLKGAQAVNKIAKNAKKMSPDDIGKFLNAGKDWHYNGKAKGKFLEQFKKQLKGDSNADFYFDKNTKEVFLKGNKSGNWVNTGKKFK